MLRHFRIFGENKRFFNDPVMRFYLRLLWAFAVYFLLGALFSFFSDHTSFLESYIRFPKTIENIFLIHTQSSPLLPFLLARFPAALLCTISVMLPIPALYALGIRKYDFFSLSPWWNLIFFAIYGMIFHRIIAWLRQSTAQLTAKESCGFIVVVVFAFFLALVIQIGCLLRANRMAAAGILIPCMCRDTQFSFEYVPSQELRPSTVKRYFRAMFRDILTCGITNLALICFILNAQYFTE
jgi:hypothetical protein